MEDYEVYTYDAIADALAEVRRQHLAGEPLRWTGPDVLHHSVSAGSPEPSWHFSEDGLEYHEEHGRDFWEVYTLVAFQLGYHNGVVREGADLRSTVDSLQRLMDTLQKQ